VRQACENTLKELKTDYLDLYLIHFPVSFQHGVKEATSLKHMTDVNLEETWKAMEQLVKDGLVKNIGVSNFEIEEIQRILKMNTVPIACNQ